MTIDYGKLMSLKSSGLRFAYTDTQALLYNLSVGMGRDPLDERELPFVFEKPDLKVLPTAAAVLGTNQSDLAAQIPVDWTQALHGEQRLRVHRPLPAAAELSGDIRVSEVVDKGPSKGALIVLEVSARLADGEPLYTMQTVMFCRGDGGFGGPSRRASPAHTLPDREPDTEHVSETRPEQALLYRLNGDRNPLHADPGFARQAGFEQPILHGLCTYGIACRAVLGSVCDYDVGRIRTFDARFTSPVFSGRHPAHRYLDGRQCGVISLSRAGPECDSHRQRPLRDRELKTRGRLKQGYPGEETP